MGYRGLCYVFRELTAMDDRSLPTGRQASTTSVRQLADRSG
ncbi:MAG: hypothetical protein NTY33_02685 [Candidatus Moranbacteria bacterium]|nr:hypothetical protein [Candidatus Moranbacteria bacterium]